VFVIENKNNNNKEILILDENYLLYDNNQNIKDTILEDSE
jgi:hypothetical protein